MTIYLTLSLSFLSSKYYNSKESIRLIPKKTAEIDPNFLYLSLEDNILYSQYEKLFEEVWDRNEGRFKEVSASQIEKLVELGKDLQNKKLNLFKDKHQIIELSFDLTKQYEELNAKPLYQKLSQSSELFNSTRENLNALFQTGRAKDAVNHILDMQKKLSHQILSFNHIYDKANNLFDFSSNRAQIKAHVKLSDFESLKSDIERFDKDEFKYLYQLVTNKQAIESHLKGEQLSKQIADLEKAKQEYHNWLNYYQSIRHVIIDLPDLTKMSLDEVKNWAHLNSISLEIIEGTSISIREVLSQMPKTSDYSQIVKGSKVTIEISKKIVNDEAPIQRINESASSETSEFLRIRTR